MESNKKGVLKYGSSSEQNLLNESEINFGGFEFNPLSFCCTPIELLSNDGKGTVISTGSGFFYQSGDMAFLVTNWHVFSGRNIFTGELISPNSFIPSLIRYYGISLDHQGDNLRFQRNGWEISLDEHALAMLEKPPIVDGVPVDIWILPIPPHTLIPKDPGRKGFSGAETFSSFVDDHVVKNITVRAGEDCLVLGYPLDNYDGLLPPVWKRVSLASEPAISLDGRPMFLLDGNTTASMSGSPIFRRLSIGTFENKTTGKLSERSIFSFLGVYAGRLQSKELSQTGLGYGWYGSLIPKVIAYYNYTPSSLNRVEP